MNGRFAQRRIFLRPVWTLCFIAMLASACASSSTGNSTQTTSAPLIIDTASDLITLDPARQFETTAHLILELTYQTLMSYQGQNLSTPVPLVAKSYTVSPDGTKFTFTLKSGLKFSDGTPLTSTDVAFSINRLVNVNGSPSFLLPAGTVASAPDPMTAVIQTSAAAPSLPSILTNPSLSIVNSNLVKANGGTDAANAATADAAQKFFDTTSAGSGPYVLVRNDPSTETDLKANPNYSGAVPVFKTVIIRNVAPTAELVDIQRPSTYEIATSIAPTQAANLQSNASVQVVSSLTLGLHYIYANLNPSVSPATANAHIQNAIRYGLDYAAIVKLAGPGARRACGVVPYPLLGALTPPDCVQTDLAKARSEVALSGIAHPSFELDFPSDDRVWYPTEAQLIQSDFAALGMTVSVVGTPNNTLITKVRAGKVPMLIFGGGNTFPDPDSSLRWVPGGLYGLRADWHKGANPDIDALITQEQVTIDPTQRAQQWTQIQRLMNAEGPMMPILQGSLSLVASKGLGNVSAASTPLAWEINVGLLTATAG